MSTSREPETFTEPLVNQYAAFPQPQTEGPLAPSAPVDPNDPPWGVLGALLTVVGSIILLFATSILFVIPYMFRAMGRGVTDLKAFLTTDKTAILLQIVSVLPAHVLTIGLCWMVVTRFGKRPFWATLGWDWGRDFGFWKSAMLAILLLIVGIIITSLTGNVETQLDQIVNSSTAARVTTALLATLTAPVVEEVVYRGVLYSALQRVAGAGWAVILVLGLFTLIHVPQYWPNYSVITTVGLLSVALTLVRAYTGRLLPCFIIHLVFNGISSVIIVGQPYLEHLTKHAEPKASAVLWLTYAALTFVNHI